MTNITDLINSISPYIPFRNEESAKEFLDQYDNDDQAALISALYIGRDHIHDSIIRSDYVPNGWAFDRYFTTGRAPKWDISPADFAKKLYEKSSNLHMYYTSFVRCTKASNYSLSNF
ncbi:hypothetical protein [Pseudomonas mandelii]|uniref:hypothetical protein n=1 Tax=Pseudomonas mandelii TaxID=75612 RepID=UPI003C75665B